MMALIFSAADYGSVLGMAHYSVFKGNIKLVYKKASRPAGKKNKMRQSSIIKVTSGE